MTFVNWKTVQDLVQIASAGGGFEIEQGFLTVPDLIKIAAAAAVSGARIKIKMSGFVSVPDLVRIASAGQGVVTFHS